MVDHLRTVLLNENSASAESAGCPWRVDPAFVPVALSADEAAVMDAMFAGRAGVAERAAVVDEAVRLMEMPDFAAFRRMFDARSTMSAGRPTPAAFSRAAAIRRKSSPDVAACLSCESASAVFSKVGDPFADQIVERTSVVFGSGFETPHRFAALMYAMAARLDARRRRM